MIRNSVSPLSVPTTDNVVFDFTMFRAADAHAMKKRGDDIEEVALIFAQCIVEVPESWGAPDDPKTYTNLPTKTHWNVLVNLFFEELNGKN